jgi:hypothetical protein
VITPQERGARYVPIGRSLSSAWQLDILASAFEIAAAEVAADARRLLTSSDPADELLASICRARGWAAEMSVFYLANLKSVVDPAAGSMPTVWS